MAPLLFRDVDQDPIARNRAFAEVMEATSFLGTPLVSKGRTVGILAVDNRLSGRDVLPGDGPLLYTVGSLIASAIENARLYTEVEGQKAALERRVAERTAALAGAIEEAQAARVSAETASATKSAFLSNVSHELRTPLTSVVGFSRLIRKRLDEVVFPAVPPGDPKVDRAMRQASDNLGIIVEEGERLTSLINDTLDLAKIEAGRMEWRHDPVDLGEVVERAVAATASLVAGADGSGGPVVVMETAPDLPTVIGDRDRLIQVVINLISNAVKFTPDGTITCRTSVSTEEGARVVVVSVQDTGVGIAPEDQERVFEQFGQAGDTLSDTPRGTGLGLPICKEIVEAHGGRIWLTSQVGHGSVFAFSLPAADRRLSLLEVVARRALLGGQDRQRHERQRTEEERQDPPRGGPSTALGRHLDGVVDADEPDDETEDDRAAVVDGFHRRSVATAMGPCAMLPARSVAPRRRATVHAGGACVSRFEWVSDSCRLLGQTAAEFDRTQPFKGLRIGTGIHLEPKTAALLLTLQRGGADVVSTGNLNTTQAETVDYLRQHGIDVIGGPTADPVEHDRDLRGVLATQAGPHPGQRRRPVRALPRGPVRRAESAGPRRRRPGRDRLLPLRDRIAKPLIVINDSPIKQFAENTHAVGPGTVEAFMRITNRITNGRRVTVFGYGSVGRGVAMYFRNFFSVVSVVEPQPVLQLRAVLDGIEVPDARPRPCRTADVIVTVTGAPNIVTAADLPLLKDGVIMMNSGHLPWEIDVRACAGSRRSPRSRRSSTGSRPSTCRTAARSTC